MPLSLLLCCLRDDGITAICKGIFTHAEGRKRLLSTVKLLLDAGADPFLGDEFNSNPLHYAMQAAKSSEDSRMVELLFDAMYLNGAVRGKVRTSPSDHLRFCLEGDERTMQLCSVHLLSRGHQAFCTSVELSTAWRIQKEGDPCTNVHAIHVYCLSVRSKVLLHGCNRGKGRAHVHTSVTRVVCCCTASIATL